MFGLTLTTKAQSPICPPTSNCSQTVTAHVVNTASDVDPAYAQSLNFNSPQRYFCLGDPIDLRGLWNPGVSLTSGRWDVISATCTNVTIPVGAMLSSASVSWPSGQTVSSSNQSKPAVPSQPGLYIFMFSGKTTTCAEIFDTAYVRVLPTPTANAGPDFIACTHSNLQGYAFMQQLNATPVGANEEGTWEWYPQNNYYISPADIHNPNAMLHALPNAYGSLTWNVWFRWKVKNLLTGCYTYDNVSVKFPNEGDPVYAGQDRPICSYTEILSASNCGALNCVSAPGAGSVYWNPASGGTPPPAYFYWEYVPNSYVPLAGGNPILANPPVVQYLWPQVTRVTAGFISTNNYQTGSYTFRYHVNGLCVQGVDDVTITFLSSAPITIPQQIPDATFCNGNNTLTFTGTTPTYPNEYIYWDLPNAGVTVLSGDTGNTQPPSTGTTSIQLQFANTNVQYTISYYIYNAAGNCRLGETFTVYPDKDPAPRPWNNTTNSAIPPITTSPYVVQMQLPCGQNSVTLPFRVINLLNNTYYPNNTNFPNIGISNSLTYVGFTGTGTPTPPTLTGNILSGLTLPGVYRVKITSAGGCSHSNDAFIDIEVQMPADGASAGSPVYLACGASSVLLAANIPVVGTGQWSLVSAAINYPGTPTINTFIPLANQGNNYATASALTTPGDYAFMWTVSNSNCVTSGQSTFTDIILINVADPTITSTNAGPDMSYCNPQDVSLSAVSQGGTGGYWTTTTSGVTFANPNSPTTQVFGLPLATNAAQSYTFTWHLLGGCGTITDNVVITIDPAICCQASSDPLYTHIANGTTYNINTVLSGKLYVEGIITVDAAVIDITNVDMVFDACAGIRFINGATIRANNSVFRACGLQESWLGLDFENGSLGIIEASSFKNAVNAINALGGNIDVKLINNNFINCKNSIASNASVLNAIISGNNFTVDQSFVNFGSCKGQGNNDYFGIVANSTNFVSGISQNNFVYSANTPANNVYGIFLIGSNAVVNANTFSNLYRTIDASRGGKLELTNNTIEISGWQTTTQHSIRITENGETAIKGNTIKYDINSREPLNPLTNSAIYAEANKLGIVISDNTIQNFETGLQLLGNDLVYVTNNQILNCKNYGIYSDGNMVNASCNEIDMATIIDGKVNSVIGIAHVFTGTTGSIELWQNAAFRSNCISECNTAIYLFTHYNCAPFQNIYNNFLYNYTDFGIYAENIRLEVGTSQQFGGNSFVSNNFHAPNSSFAQAVDLAAVNCAINAIGNFGILNISGSVSMSNDREYHSTATCAKQVSYKPNDNAFNSNQQFTSLEMCNEYDAKTMSFFGKSANTTTLNNNWNEMFEAMPISNRYTCAYSILFTVSKNELDVTFNRLKSIEFQNSNDVLFLEVVYYLQKNDLTLASQKLSVINPTNNNEADLKAITQIELDLMLAKKSWRGLNQTQQNTLTAIEAKKSVNSTIARDLLQAANGKNDYGFTSTKQLTTKTEGKVVNLSSSNLLIYPNPASNNLTLELVNAADDNATINIFDALGQRIYQARANIKAGKLSIDVSSLAKGLYHVQLLGTDNKSLNNTFIKQ